MNPQELIDKLTGILQESPEAKDYKMAVVVNVGASDVDLLLESDIVIIDSYREIQLMVEE